MHLQLYPEQNIKYLQGCETCERTIFQGSVVIKTAVLRKHTHKPRVTQSTVDSDAWRKNNNRDPLSSLRENRGREEKEEKHKQGTKQ